MLPPLVFLFVIIKWSFAHDFIENFVDASHWREGLSIAGNPTVLVVVKFGQHRLFTQIAATLVRRNVRLKGQIFEPVF